MRAPRLAVLLTATALTLAACGDSGSDAQSTPTAGGGGDVTATGTFGEKPTLTIPDGEGPSTTTSEKLVEGSGDTVAKGDFIVVNYLGQTWEPKDGEPNVFDNSYDRGQPTGFLIGEGAVIKGWDSQLVGSKVGDRVLLEIPAADAYGEDPAGGNGLGGQDLVFVVDVVGTVKKTATAEGTPAKALPAGFPTVTSEPGKEPAITSVAGVTQLKAGDQPLSGLLLTGSGDAIDPKKSLVVQLVQTDVATGKQTQSSWQAGGPQMVPAEQVLGTIPALKDAKIGSRAVLVTPPSEAQGQAQPSLVVVADVVAQF